MRDRLSQLYRTEEEYELLESYLGSELKGKRYTPLFDYFVGEYENSFQVFLNFFKMIYVERFYLIIT